MSKTVKNIIIAAAVIIVALFAYRFFFVASPERVLEGRPIGTQAVGRELLNILSTLQSLTLDDRVFSNPSFRSLQDFSVPVTENPLGRRNPFAPLGIGNIETFVGTPITPPITLPEEELPEEETVSDEE